MLPKLVLVLLRPRLEHLEALAVRSVTRLGQRQNPLLQRRIAILEKQVKSLRLAAGALAEAAYLGDTLEPSDSEDEMEAESDLDNGDEEITDLVSDGENA